MKETCGESEREKERDRKERERNSDSRKKRDIEADERGEGGGLLWQEHKDLKDKILRLKAQ